MGRNVKIDSWAVLPTFMHVFHLLLSSAPPSADPAVVVRMLESQELTRPSSSHAAQGQTKWSETHKSRQLLISPASFFDSPCLLSLSSCTSAFLLSLTLHCFVAFSLFCGLYLSFTFPSLSLFPSVCALSLCSPVSTNPTSVCTSPGSRFRLQATVSCLLYFKTPDNPTTPITI